MQQFMLDMDLLMRRIHSSKTPFDKDVALLSAAIRKNIPVVKYLIELGVDVQICNKLELCAEIRAILDDNAPWKLI